MSKRARITLAPPASDMQADRVAEAILAAEQAAEPETSPAGSALPRQAKDSKPHGSSTLIKVALAGVVMVVAFWLLKGRRF